MGNKMKTKKMVYISGPISDIPNDNAEAFAAAERDLTARGYDTYNPQRKNRAMVRIMFGVADGEPTYAQWMAASLSALHDCDAIAFLSGSENSVGAGIEKAVANQHGMPEVVLIGEVG